MDIAPITQFLAEHPDSKAIAAGVAGFFLRGSAADLWGLGFGDWLAVRRLENLTTLKLKSEERLKSRGVREPKELPLNLSGPLLNSASMEDREELLDIWAELLATAMDPTRSSSVRKSFIDTIKKFEPLDALVFNGLAVVPVGLTPSSQMRDFCVKLGVNNDSLTLSLLNLDQLGCTNSKGGQSLIKITPYGRELLRVLGANVPEE